MNIEEATFILAIMLIVINLITLGWMYMELQNAYGTAIVDHAADCSIQEYPYIQWCAREEQQDIIDKLLERAKEWNNTH